MTRTLLMTVLGLSLFGCAAEEASVPAPAEPPPAAAEPEPEPARPDEALATLAKAIEANPANAEALLKEAGYTIDRFEAELVAIAKDPARAAAWVE